MKNETKSKIYFYKIFIWFQGNLYVRTDCASIQFSSVTGMMTAGTNQTSPLTVVSVAGK